MNTIDTTTKANSPSDYIALYRWGKNMGSFESYIRNEQATAFADKAPINAIYKRDDWHTAETIVDKTLRNFIINGSK